jgi:hypothetical protein
MAGLVLAIRCGTGGAQMAGTSPAMTERAVVMKHGCVDVEHSEQSVIISGVDT